MIIFKIIKKHYSIKKKIYFFEIAGLITTSALFAQNSKTFVIDAGHGGHDVGSKNSVITESEYSLELAQKIQKLAKEKNIKVILTRTENDFLDLQS